MGCSFKRYKKGVSIVNAFQNRDMGRQRQRIL